MEWVLISCPVLAREWILPTWFEAIENQDFPLSNIGFAFELAPNDQPTLEALMQFYEQHPEVRCFDLNVAHHTRHQKHPEAGRQWNYERYQAMVELRNSLLARVRCHNPDRLFSLDSDIILKDPTTISTLFELTKRYDVVSPLMYMTPNDTNFPSVMTWTHQPGGKAFRQPQGYPIGSIFKADVVMAAKMMTRKAYGETQYKFHSLGEDLGWSTSCHEKGIDLYCASYIYCPHIMSRAHLEEYNRQGDLREAGYLC